MLVKIKTWGKMNQEYGKNPYGSIDTPGDSFTLGMEGSLPHHRIIEVEEQGYRNSIYRMYRWHDKRKDTQ